MQAACPRGVSLLTLVAVSCGGCAATRHADRELDLCILLLEARRASARSAAPRQRWPRNWRRRPAVETVAAWHPPAITTTGAAPSAASPTASLRKGVDRRPQLPAAFVDKDLYDLAVEFDDRSFFPDPVPPRIHPTKEQYRRLSGLGKRLAVVEYLVIEAIGPLLGRGAEEFMLRIARLVRHLRRDLRALGRRIKKMARRSVRRGLGTDPGGWKAGVKLKTNVRVSSRPSLSMSMTPRQPIGFLDLKVVGLWRAHPANAQNSWEAHLTLIEKKF